MNTTTKQTQYVLGFAFSEDLEYLLLIEKKRPKWQAGKLNGIGGKIDDNEEPLDAMVREFKEETTISIPPFRWKEYGHIAGPNYHVALFTAPCPDLELEYHRISPPTDEFILCLKTDLTCALASSHTVANVPGLVQLAKARLLAVKDPEIFYVGLAYAASWK
jgi:8-oxo-dGTP pyrophosphatase MutT (NUDIX family)